ncbi:MAG: hypothetical protein IKD69_05095, partial [Solobacterium sp.]|nr:hypothetical protein [Solobacterium sp.]
LTDPIEKEREAEIEYINASLLLAVKDQPITFDFSVLNAEEISYTIRIDDELCETGDIEKGQTTLTWIPEAYGEYVFSIIASDNTGLAKVSSVRGTVYQNTTREEWLRKLKETELSGQWDLDLITLAKSQLGFSMRDIISLIQPEQGFAAEHDSRKEEEMLAEFLLHSAGISHCQEYAVSQGIIEAGDIIWLDYQNDGIIDHEAFVTAVNEGTIEVAEVNAAGIIARGSYSQGDEAIVSHMDMSALQADYQPYAIETEYEDLHVTVYAYPLSGIANDCEAVLYEVPLEEKIIQETDRLRKVVSEKAFDIAFFTAEGEQVKPQAEIRIEVQGIDENVILPRTTYTADKDKTVYTAKEDLSFEYISFEQLYELVSESDSLHVSLVYDRASGIDESCSLQLEEVQEQESYAERLDSLYGEYDSARFFMLHIQDAQGMEMEPLTDVSVFFEGKSDANTKMHVIEMESLAEAEETDEDNVETVSLMSILPSVKEHALKNAQALTAEETADENQVHSPVYGVVYTTLYKTFEAEGENYIISVTYGPDAQIPVGSDLEVSEITVEAPSGYGMSYEEYVASSESALGMTAGSAGYIRLFDISILHDGEKVQPEPTSKVEVRIALADTQSENLSVVHFADEEKTGSVVETEAEEAEYGKAVAFMTDGFSVYAVVDVPTMPQIEVETARTLQEVAQNTDRAFFFSVNRISLPEYFTSSLNSNSAFIPNTSVNSAAAWYFEPVDNQANHYRIATEIGGTKYYMVNTSGNLMGLSETDSTEFILEHAANGLFNLKLANGNKWLQYSGSGNGFRLWTDIKNNANSRITLTYADSFDLPQDPLRLDGMTYGLMHYTTGISGEALMADAASASSLRAEETIVRVDPSSGSEKLYVAKDSEISMWTFHYDHDDCYTLSAEVDGQTKYLKLDGNSLSLVDEADATSFQVAPGSGNRLRLVSEGKSVSFSSSGKAFNGANLGNNSEWLELVQESDLTDDNFVIHSAYKVSVSDTVNVKDGAQILIYKRVWNDEEKKYDFYAVDQDGNLVPCLERGDTIQWVGTKLNKLLWTFTEEYRPGTNTPSYSYKLYNPYSEKYLAPSFNDGAVLSDTPSSVNLSGRRYGDYYTTIIAWDDPHYAYAALKAEDGQIVSCPLGQAEDFYFAIMQEETDHLTEVETVDHVANGITMKIVDFNNPTSAPFHPGGPDTTIQQHEVLGESVYDQNNPHHLVSTELGVDGYPTALLTGKSFAELFGDAEEVNHLFLQGTYSGTGYYEFDSTQNFATLQDDGTFKVYEELGTMDGSSKPSLKHGQFMPYNDLTPGVFATVNSLNLYDAEQHLLADDDPRKYEKLHKVNNPDYFFGLQLEASFVQTPSGLDDWGHDIIYEFTGDDDFWLYVDGELVIDLGGIHSALPGKVNYRTGEVVVNGVQTTLYDIFRRNYAVRNGLDPESHEAYAYVNEIFTRNENHQYIFKDYSTHTMKIFFMERGAGASNLHMRFNLSAVKPGQVLLNKTVSGTEKLDYSMAEYPFQVYYRMEEGGEELLLPEHTGSTFHVTHQKNNNPVEFRDSYTPPGGSAAYQNVFFVNAGETVAITLPQDAVDYRIVECAVNTEVYDSISANDENIHGTDSGNPHRKDYAVPFATAEDRKRVSFDNHVNKHAIRTLTITKKLYEVDGVTEITDDDTEFNFRLALGSENSPAPEQTDRKEYYVKDPDGWYCKWVEGTGFVSIGKRNFQSMKEEEIAQVTFHTSMYGAISRIPAGYQVEVRDLLVGMKFAVTEEFYEIPAGYDLIGYEREGSTYIIEEGEAVNHGTIRSNDSPSIIVKNKRGFGLTVEKKWSDADFMESHDHIYFAVYRKTGTNSEEMIPDTVRVLQHPARSIYYYFDTLAENAELEDYVIREVTPDR